MAAATSGLDSFNRLYSYPENFSQKSVLPKPVSVVTAVLSGMMKTLFFPILSAISTIGFFIKGCYEAAKGNDQMVFSFEASLISLAGFLASGAFFVLAAYTMPIIISSHIVLAAMVITVSVHIYRATSGDDKTQVVAEPKKAADFGDV